MESLKLARSCALEPRNEAKVWGMQLYMKEEMNFCNGPFFPLNYSLSVYKMLYIAKVSLNPRLPVPFSFLYFSCICFHVLY